jgi:pheromone a factor receptor
MTILAFIKRRKQFQDLMSRNRNLTYSRYFRLMLLAGIDLCCTVPLSIYSIYLNTVADPNPVSPWISWEETHYDYSRVIQYPRVIYSLDQNNVVSLEITRWMMVICAIMFFGFFGFADEAKKHYRIAFTSVAKSVGYTTIDSFQSPSSATYVYSSTRSPYLFSPVCSFSGFSGKFPGSGKESKGLSSFSKPSMRLDLPVFITKETEVARDTDTVSSYSDKLSTSIYLGEATMGDLTITQIEPYSPTDTSPTVSRYIPSPTPSEDREIQFPEPILDSSSIRRPSVPEDVV